MDTSELIVTAIKTQTALQSIGSNPLEDGDDTKVKGEETDSLVVGVKHSWLYLLAIGGIGSASTFLKEREVNAYCFLVGNPCSFFVENSSP